MDTQDPSMSPDLETNYLLFAACYNKCNSLLNGNVSKEEFTRQYRQFCDAEWKKKGFYIVILNSIEIAMMKDEMFTLKKMDTFIAYVTNIENECKLRDFYNSTSNAMRNTNPVILACKHNKIGILKYVLNSEILNNLSVIIGRNAITFNDEDEECHNAFYYSVRSNNVELLDTLINKWPGGPLTAHSLELDETLSNVYKELQLKNVILSDHMRIYVENKLIELRFFSDEFPQSPIVNNNFANIIERIQLLTEYVNRLVYDYSKTRVDERFLFVTKCIVQNIHILKQQLKSTYNKIPWEEMEFCLTSFISSYMEKREINLFYRVTLNKTKMLRYLKDFVKALENEGDFELFTDLPKEERAIITSRLINIYPQFEELYADHRRIRDAYSLYRMSDYIKLALTFDPREKSGQLIILRALQVIGDCLKNTLESPKLSHCVSKLLLLTFPENTRKIVTDLRNSLSHADSLAVRIKIEETSDVKFFVDVQNAIKRIGVTIDGMLHEKIMKTMSALLKEIIDTESLERLREAAEVLNATEFNSTTKEDLESFNLRVLITQLYVTISGETKYEKMFLEQILNVIGASTEFQESNTADLWTNLLQFVNFLHWNDNKIDSNSVTRMKTYAKTSLENMKLLANSINPKIIAELLQPVLSSIELMRTGNNDTDFKLRRIVGKISYLLECAAGVSEHIQGLGEKLTNKGPFKGTPLYKSKKSYDAFLARRISQLKYILTSNALMSNTFKNMSAYKTNKRLQSVIEMLVLDILDCADDCLDDNLFFYDDNSLMLTGKCLRDHLAHDNTIINVLVPDPSTMVALNAAKLISEDIIKSKRKLGRRMKDDCLKLRNKYNQGLLIITLQEGMFAALEEGRVDDFRNYLQQGADIYGRNPNLSSALHFAAKGPAVETVDYVLRYSFNANVKDAEGKSPLHIAAANGRTDIVKYFIEALGVDVNVTDNCLKTPLLVAVENGHQDTVEILLANNAKVNMQDIGGNVPLHCAVKNNCIDIVKTLMKKGANIDVSEKSGLQFSPLHKAAESGHVDLVNFFINNKVDVDVRSAKYVTPLHLAAVNGHLEVVQALISHGADVNVRVTGCTPLHYAVGKSHEAIAEVLLTHGADPNIADNAHNSTALHYAAFSGRTNMVLSLLRNGANANLMNIMNMTPLHFAVQGGHFEVVNILIGRGVNVNAENKFGATPLYYAAGEGHKEIAELLVKNGANVNCTGNEFSPLHVAAETKQPEIVNFLIKNKAKVNLRVKYGTTPLHFAASSPNNENVVRHLLDNKASVNIKNSYGMTPLHVAAAIGCPVNASLLIAHKAKVNALTKDGQTPLHLAVHKGHKEVVTLLIEHNASVNTGGNMATPLQLAVFNGYKEVVEILFRNGAIIENSVENLAMLLGAVKCNYKEIVELLMENGIYKLQSGSSEVLAVAVTAGHTEIVETFLRYGAPVNNIYPDQSIILHVAGRTGYIDTADAVTDVNPTYDSNVTLLHLAAQEGYDKIVKLLVRNGAMINVKSFEGNSPLHLAVEMGHSNIVKILLDNGATIDDEDGKNRTPLEMAVTHDHLEVLKTLFKYKKFDLNSDYNGSKLLHTASQTPNLEMVKYLVDEGADVHSKNSCHLKAIHVAAKKGDKAIVEYFLSKGLSVNELDVHDKTPLHYAVQESRFEVVKYLIDQGADVNAKSDEGVTPLHMAATTKFKDVIKLLLKNGAMYNCANKSNKLPSDCTDDEHIIKLLTVNKRLFEAVKRNDANSTKKCIKAGAIVNVRNANNVTPLHYAVREGYDTIVYILLENGANPDAMSEGHTPLHYAAELSYLKMVTVLLTKGATYNVLSIFDKTPLDLATDNDVRQLLTLIGESFRKVKGNDASLIVELQQIKDIERIKAVLNARNEDGETLVVAGMHSNFSNVDMLTEVSQGNMSSQIEAGIALLDKRDYKAAFIIFKNAYQTRRCILGPENPATLDVQTNMAEALYQQGTYYNEALTIYEDIFQKQNETLGSHDHSTLNTQSMIALTLHRLGRHEEALRIYRDIYQKREETLGPNHEITVNIQFQIGISLTHLERYDEALDVYTAVYEKRKNEFGVNHPSTVRAQNSIAAVLNKQGKPEEALRMYEDIFEKRKAIHGLLHTCTFQTLYNIATIFFQQNEYHAALNSYQNLLSLQKSLLGPDHRDTLNTHHCIISLHVKQCKRFTALKACANVLHRMKVVLPPSDPILLSTLDILEKINCTFKIEATNISTAISSIQEKIYNAAANGDVKVIERMFREGFDLNDADFDGKTLLHSAASKGQMKVVEFLWENGAYLNVTSNKGKTPLHVASENGHKNIVEFLLQRIRRDKLNDYVNSETTVTCTTALHIAAQNGFLDIVRCLLSYGAIYNAGDEDGKIPCDLSKNESVADLLRLIEELFEHAKNGNIEIVSELSILKVTKPDEFVAIMNARNVQMNTILQVVIANQYKNVANALLNLLL